MQEELEEPEVADTEPVDTPASTELDDNVRYSPWGDPMPEQPISDVVFKLMAGATLLLLLAGGQIASFFERNGLVGLSTADAIRESLN